MPSEYIECSLSFSTYDSDSQRRMCMLARAATWFIQLRAVEESFATQTYEEFRNQDALHKSHSTYVFTLFVVPGAPDKLAVCHNAVTLGCHHPTSIDLANTCSTV